jgi:hypothetical protein
VFTYSQAAAFGKIAFMLWLVDKGARHSTPDATASSSEAA